MPKKLHCYQHKSPPPVLPSDIMSAIGDRPWVRQAELAVVAPSKAEAARMCERVEIWQLRGAHFDLHHDGDDAQLLKLAGGQPGVYVWRLMARPSHQIFRVESAGVIPVCTYDELEALS